jgi:hypothetical protein
MGVLDRPEDVVISSSPVGEVVRPGGANQGAVTTEMKLSVWACAPLNGEYPRPPLGGLFLAVYLPVCRARLRAEGEWGLVGGLRGRWQRKAEVGVDQGR